MAFSTFSVLNIRLKREWTQCTLIYFPYNDDAILWPKRLQNHKSGPYSHIPKLLKPNSLQNSSRFDSVKWEVRIRSYSKETDVWWIKAWISSSNGLRRLNKGAQVVWAYSFMMVLGLMELWTVVGWKRTETFFKNILSLKNNNKVWIDISKLRENYDAISILVIYFLQSTSLLKWLV